MVRKFYLSYATTIQNTLPKGMKPLAKPRLTHTKGRGQQVDISETTIHRMLFGPKFPTPRSISEFEQKLRQTKDLTLMRDADCIASLMRWVAGWIIVKGSKPAWEATLSVPIFKASLSYPTKFLWVVVKSRIRSMLVDNSSMLEHPMLVSSILVGYEIDSAHLIVE